MDFILGTVAPLVFEYSIGPIARHVSYPFNYRTKVASLEDGVKELKSARDDRKRWVDEHERNGKEISQDVLDWLKDVSVFIEKEVSELDHAKEKTKKKWCLGFCPNLKTRYQVSKKAEQKAEVAASFSEKNATFSADQHVHTPPLQSIEGFSSKDFKAFESRMSILEDIMKALASVDVSTIGVHGVGGVGKTTLAREVLRKAQEEKLFDEVIMVTVTIDVDVTNIQKAIADFLGLHFNEESKEGRAARLCERLMKKEKKTLVILDDLWKKLKLEEVGIPQPGEHTGCKLLLTSRNSNVLSNEMGSQKLFPIDVLAEDEAWGLFQKMSNSRFDDPVAKAVARWCAGLPIAIVTVASSLKGKDSYEWRNALTTLKTTPPEDLPEMLAEVYWPIQFSYDQLEAKELQPTFLLCCQLGYNATIRDLLRYGIGLGLFDVVKVEDAQCRVYSLVRELKRRCLLLEGSSNRQLVVHDLVRDVGSWIAYHQHGVVVVAADRNNPKDWTDEEKIKTYKRIWLYNNAVKLPEEWQCPDLVFLHINGKDGDLQLPPDLHKLKVLSLTGFKFSSLPSSVGLLKNLTTLSFYQSYQPSQKSGIGLRIVGELKKLEVLSLAKSKIRSLPKEIGQLTNLKLLDLSGCNALEYIASNVLSKLTRLEELYMANSFAYWEMEGRNNASLTELKQLHFLSNLEIEVRNSNLIQEGVFSENLCRYRIVISDDSRDGLNEREVETVKMLKLKPGHSKYNMPNGVLHLLKETQVLYLIGVYNMPNGQVPFHTLTPTDGSSFQNLTELWILSCHRMKYAFSYSLTKRLCRLKILSLDYCNEMEEVIGIEEGSEEEEQSMNNNKVIVFPQLLQLELLHLEKLKRFCKGYLLECPLLKELDIRGCPDLKTFITREHEEMRLEGTDQNATPTPVPSPPAPALFNDMVIFPSLVQMFLKDRYNMETIWDNQLASGSFGELRELKIRSCHKLRKVFPSSQHRRFQKLEKLTVSDSNLVEEIVEDEEEGSNNHVISFQLRDLELKCLPKLKNVFPYSIATRLQKLERIVIEQSGVEEIVAKAEMDELTSLRLHKAIVFPELLQLRLCSLEKLKSFCKDYLLKCPLLKELEIKRCTNLKTFITREYEEMNQNATPNLFDDMVIFPRLVQMDMEHLHSMESIWDNQLASGSFVELRKLSIEECHKLRKIFPSAAISFQCLTTLLVSKCHQLLSLMTCTAAKSLTQLTRMRITECQMLEQIVGNEENVAEIGVTLTKLESLELHCLPSLLAFSLWNCAFTFPSLKDVVVIKCPKMKIFSQGVITAPKLRRVTETEGKWKWFWEGSLNASIQKLYVDQAMLQSSQPSSPKKSNLDHQEDPIQDQSLSTPMDIPSISQEQMDGFSTDQNKTIPPSSTEQSVHGDATDTPSSHNQTNETIR